MNLATSDAAHEALLEELERAIAQLVAEGWVKIRDIRHHVTEYYGIRQKDLSGGRRKQPLARRRQIAIYLTKRITNSSGPLIGRRFGGRDNSTVLHAIKKIEELKGKSAEVATDLLNLCRRLAEDDVVHPSTIVEPDEIDIILQAVTTNFHIDLIDLTDPTLRRSLSRYGWIAMYLCRTLTNKTYGQISAKFGGCNPVVIRDAVKKVEALMKSDRRIAGDIKCIQKALREL